MKESMEALSPEALHLLANRFKLLASPTRLAIMQHICHDERTVSELVDLTDFKQANVSRQLSMLHRGGLVRRRTAGTNVYYTVADASLPQLCTIMRDSLRARQDELLASLGRQG
jgi:DNA-binding transcriptional ArsR family regulator